MLPLSDGIPARRFPIVNVLLIVANFAVFIFRSSTRRPGAMALHGIATRNPLLATTGEAGRPWRRCAPAQDRVWSVLS
jgi:hypothetical protein